MNVNRIKSLSQIKREAKELLKGNRLKYVGLFVLVSIIQAVLGNAIPFAGLLISGFVSFIVANLSLSIIDRKDLSIDALTDFKQRPMEIFLAGLIVIGISTIVILIPIVPLGISMFFMSESSTVSYVFITIVVSIIILITIISIYITIKFSFAFNILYDEQIKGFDAIKKSFNLTKGNFFRILGLQLIFVFYGVMIFILTMLIFSPIMIVAFSNDPSTMVNGVMEFSDAFVGYLMIYIGLALFTTSIFALFWLTPYCNVSLANLYRTIVIEKGGEKESPIVHSDNVPFLE